jgi:hypothetical protein
MRARGASKRGPPKAAPLRTAATTSGEDASVVKLVGLVSKTSKSRTCLLGREEPTARPLPAPALMSEIQSLSGQRRNG